VSEQVSDALERLEERVMAAEGHQYNLGQQLADLWHRDMVIEAMPIAIAAEEHRKQFGPWLERRLYETYKYGINSIKPVQ
jgi:uncharacterized protein YggL (DUF469 family)